jgi:hypothetical protein
VKQLTFRKCPKCGGKPICTQTLIIGGNDYVCVKGHNWPADDDNAPPVAMQTSMEPE